MSYNNILFDVQDQVAPITLNRPAVHNCMSDEMVGELTEAFNSARGEKSVRLVLLSAHGHSFCAGADLNDMKNMIKYTEAENIEESSHLLKLMTTVKASEVPVIARVQGPVYGGGCGLVACSDIAIATPAVTFCFSEVKLGLIPAVISPYVYAKIGESQMRRYFLTAEMIDAHEARRIGLVHIVVQQDDLDAETDRLSRHVLANGPEALKAVKRLVKAVAADPVTEDVRNYTVDAIAQARVGPEAQERLAAFFAQRRAH